MNDTEQEPFGSNRVIPGSDLMREFLEYVEWSSGKEFADKLRKLNESREYVPRGIAMVGF